MTLEFLFVSFVPEFFRIDYDAAIFPIALLVRPVAPIFALDLMVGQGCDDCPELNRIGIAGPSWVLDEVVIVFVYVCFRDPFVSRVWALILDYTDESILIGGLPPKC